MFSEAKAHRVTQFIECLRHTKGEFHGQPFKLLPWQDARKALLFCSRTTLS